MIEKVTAATLEAEGLPDNERTRMLTWVIINEVKDGNWGAGGGVVRLADIGRAFGVTPGTPRAPEPVAAR
jgi:phenylpyruvate tautomerase PptA (4-oxalocrotonate tautomerase family)